MQGPDDPKHEHHQCGLCLERDLELHNLREQLAQVTANYGTLNASIMTQTVRAEEAEAQLKEVQAELDLVGAQTGAYHLVMLNIYRHAQDYSGFWSHQEAKNAMAELNARSEKLLAAQRSCEAIDADLRAGKIAAFDLGQSDAANALDRWRYPEKYSH